MSVSNTNQAIEISDNGDSAAVYAGGLVGYVNIASGGDNPNAGKAAYNFAASSVTAQPAVSSAVYAGDVTGYIEAGELTNNAAVTRGTAMGEITRITLKGGDSGNSGLGRVYGASAGTAGNNCALKTMYLGQTANYDDYSTASGPGFNSVPVPATVDVPAHDAWDMSGSAQGYPELND
jgi:hypothetical protein